MTYVRLSDEFAPRNNRRNRRITTRKNRITSAIAAAGATSARKVKGLRAVADIYDANASISRL